MILNNYVAGLEFDRIISDMVIRRPHRSEFRPTQSIAHAMEVLEYAGAKGFPIAIRYNAKALGAWSFATPGTWTASPFEVEQRVKLWEGSAKSDKTNPSFIYFRYELVSACHDKSLPLVICRAAFLMSSEKEWHGIKP